MFRVLNSKQQLILHAICHVVVALLLALLSLFFMRILLRVKKKNGVGKKFQTLIHSFTTYTHTQWSREEAKRREISDVDEGKGGKQLANFTLSATDQAQSLRRWNNFFPCLLILFKSTFALSSLGGNNKNFTFYTFHDYTSERKAAATASFFHILITISCICILGVCLKVGWVKNESFKVVKHFMSPLN